MHADRLHASSRGRDVPSRRVLIVDEDREVRAALASLVRSWGHHVDVACELWGAVVKLPRFAPDAVVVHLNPPYQRGLEIARAMRAGDTAPSLVVALGASTEPREETRTFAAAFDHYLRKPDGLRRLRGLLAGVAPSFR